MTFPTTKSRFAYQQGILFLGVGLLDLAHMLVFKGMPFYINGNPTTWLWTISRLTESIGLIIILQKQDQPLSVKKRWFPYLLTFLLTIAAIAFVLTQIEHFPKLLVEGTKSTTSLKSFLEYTTSFLHLMVGLFVLRQYKDSRNPKLLDFALASLILLFGKPT